MRTPISILLALAALGLAGCVRERVVRDDSVAARFARSLPKGAVQQGNQTLLPDDSVLAEQDRVLRAYVAANAAQQKKGQQQPAPEDNSKKSSKPNSFWKFDDQPDEPVKPIRTKVPSSTPMPWGSFRGY